MRWRATLAGSPTRRRSAANAAAGARRGARIWICEECAQIKAYARAFVTQARDHFASFADSLPDDITSEGSGPP